MSIEGSKPRKFVKKLNLHNPTLNSFHVTTLFNPQIYHHLTNNKSFTNEEALAKAQHDFNSSRITEKNMPASLPKQRPLESSIQKTQPVRQTPIQSFSTNLKTERSPSPAHIEQSNQTSFRNLNYLNSQSIKRKQLHGYNILSNF